MIERIDGPHFKQDDQLRRQLYSVLEPSYQDCSALLNRVLARCDTLYVFRGGDGGIEACFLVGDGKLSIRDQSLPTVFLGLIARTEQSKNTGVVRLLYNRFLVDAAERERISGVRLLLWATTATPSSFHALHSLFAETQPSISGGFDEWGKELVLPYERQRGGLKHPNTHSASSMSPPELDIRIGKECVSQGCVNRRNSRCSGISGSMKPEGDRLIMICRVPPV